MSEGSDLAKNLIFTLFQKTKQYFGCRSAHRLSSRKIIQRNQPYYLIDEENKELKIGGAKQGKNEILRGLK